MTKQEDNFTAFMSKLHPSFAKKVVMASKVKTEKIPLISKGLTRELGGGIARGRILFLWGNTSAGKTAFCLQSIAKWQEMGLVCAFIDVEGTYDAEWAAGLGVDNDKLIMVPTNNSSGRVEEAVTPLIKAQVDVLVLDSISEIMPETFVDKDGSLNDQDGRKQMGAHAVAIGNLIKAIQYNNERTAVILISQSYTNLGNTHAGQTPHGGQKAQFGSSQIVQVSSSGTDQNQIKEVINVDGRMIEKSVARKVNFHVRKNKLGAHNGRGEWVFYYAGDHLGVDECRELISLAVQIGVVNKNVGWYTYRDEKINGEEKFATRLRSEPDMFEQLSADVDRGFVE